MTTERSAKHRRDRLPGRRQRGYRIRPADGPLVHGILTTRPGAAFSGATARQRLPMAVEARLLPVRYRDPQPDRARRHGRDLPRHRRGARADGRGQGARRGATRRSRHPGALHARGLSRPPALRSTERRHDLRRRRVARTPVHRHGVPRRRLGRGRASRRARPPRPGARVARAGGARARRRSRRRDRPPRRQARATCSSTETEPARRRLRDRERGRDGLAHAHRHGARDRLVPLAGAGAGGARHTGERPLRARGGRVRAPHGRAAVQGRHRGGRSGGARQRPGAGDQRAAARPAAELDHVFARALAKRPEERYASAAELVAAVRDALHAGRADAGFAAPARSDLAPARVDPAGRDPARAPRRRARARRAARGGRRAAGARRDDRPHRHRARARRGR